MVVQSDGCIKAEHNINLGDLVMVIDTIQTEHMYGVVDVMLGVGDIFTVRELCEDDSNKIYHEGYAYSALDLKVVKSA